jgi:hypothetical protein
VISRALGVAGGGATILSVSLTWVTVTGLTFTLDLDLISADAGAGNRTVAGTDTALWPAIVAVGALPGTPVLLAGGILILVGGAQRRVSRR